MIMGQYKIFIYKISELWSVKFSKHFEFSVEWMFYWSDVFKSRDVTRLQALIVLISVNFEH
jgi:hypothetical protein